MLRGGSRREREAMRPASPHGGAGLSGTGGTGRSAAGDLAGLEAGRAHGHPAPRARADEGAHGLHVRVPPPGGAAVGVGHRLAEAGPLAADVAQGGHGKLLEISSKGPAERRAGQPRQCSQRRRGRPNPYPAGPGRETRGRDERAARRQEVAEIDTLDASAVRRWCGAAVAGLESRRRELDDLNVYPVPDGDTGTNMLLTLRAADAALRSDTSGDPAATLAAMAHGAVLGA